MDETFRGESRLRTADVWKSFRENERFCRNRQLFFFLSRQDVNRQYLLQFLRKRLRS